MQACSTSAVSSTLVVPFVGISVKQASLISGDPERTIRHWCHVYALGQRPHSTGSSDYTINLPEYLCWTESPKGRVEVQRYREGEPPGERLRAHFHDFKEKK